jgi:hypothetical protein
MTTLAALRSGPTLRTLAIALPFVFVLHVVEETPRFVAWFNSLVTPDITQSTFLSVNVAGLAITLIVAAVAAGSRNKAACLVGVAWVGFLMLANGLLHVVATAVHLRYSPGFVTSLLLYLPFTALFMRAVVMECAMSWRAVLVTALIGGTPMYVHGYLIVFRGSRLF